MHIPFEEMPDNARLWIYQADRQLTESEEIYIKNETASFLEGWAAHGAGLNSSYTIAYHQFLIIAVDEAMVKASGCSIDKQVQFIQALGQNLLINFMDRTKIAFLLEHDTHAEQKEVVIAPLNELKQKVVAGNIKENTLTFNNLIETKAQLKQNWIVPASDSWLKRYFH